MASDDDALVIGRAAIEVIPDTRRFPEETKTAREWIEKKADPLKLGCEPRRAGHLYLLDLRECRIERAVHIDFAVQLRRQHACAHRPIALLVTAFAWPRLRLGSEVTEPLMPNNRICRRSVVLISGRRAERLPVVIGGVLAASVAIESACSCASRCADRVASRPQTAGTRRDTPARQWPASQSTSRKPRRGPASRRRT